MIFTPFIFLYHFFINKLPNKSKICNITKNICIINICIDLNYLLSNIISAIIIDFYNNTQAFYLNFLINIFIIFNSYYTILLVHSTYYKISFCYPLKFQMFLVI